MTSPLTQWLAAKGVRPVQRDGGWWAHLGVEQFSHDDNDPSGSRCIVVTYSGRGDSRDAALADLGERMQRQGLLTYYRGRVHGVRGLVLQETA